MITRQRLLIAFAVLASVYAQTVAACSTCMVGDPTMTLMGTEKPYKGRLRLSADLLTRDETIGQAGVNQRTIDEAQFGVNIAYAPGTRYMLGLRLPYVRKQLESYNLANEEASALGDVRLTIKLFLQQKEQFQRHMYGLLAGIRLPTAEEQFLDNGAPVDPDAQPGVGASVVNGGAWYGYYNFPFLGFASATYHHMTGEGYQGFRAGDALVSTLGVQYSSSVHLAWQLSLESRNSEPDTYFGVDDPNSGGYIGFIVPGLVYTIRTDLLVNANVKIPAIDRLDGDHEEGTVYTVGLTYDF